MWLITRDMWQVTYDTWHIGGPSQGVWRGGPMRGLGSSHVTCGPMRGLEKNCMGRGQTHRQTDRRTTRPIELLWAAKNGKKKKKFKKKIWSTWDFFFYQWEAWDLVMWPVGQWEASKNIEWRGQTHRQTNRQTDIATLWLNRPSGPIQWKSIIKLLMKKT